MLFWLSTTVNIFYDYIALPSSIIFVGNGRRSVFKINETNLPEPDSVKLISNDYV